MRHPMAVRGDLGLADIAITPCTIAAFCCAGLTAWKTPQMWAHGPVWGLLFALGGAVCLVGLPLAAALAYRDRPGEPRLASMLCGLWAVGVTIHVLVAGTEGDGGGTLFLKIQAPALAGIALLLARAAACAQRRGGRLRLPAVVLLLDALAFVAGCRTQEAVSPDAEPEALAAGLARGGRESPGLAKAIFARSDELAVAEALTAAFESALREERVQHAATLAFYLAWSRPAYMTRQLERSDLPALPGPMHEAVEAAAWRAVRIKFGDPALDKPQPGEEPGEEPPLPECPFALELRFDGEKQRLTAVLRNTGARPVEYLASDAFAPVGLSLQDAAGTDLPGRNVAPPDYPAAGAVYSTLAPRSDTEIESGTFRAVEGTLYYRDEATRSGDYELREEGREGPAPSGMPLHAPFAGYRFGWQYRDFLLPPGAYRVRCDWTSGYGWKSAAPEPALPVRAAPLFYADPKASKERPPGRWSGTVRSDWLEIVLPPVEGKDGR